MKTKTSKYICLPNTTNSKYFNAGRKSKPNKMGMKLPPAWKKLAARVGAFRTHTIKMRMGRINKYRIALLRMRNITKRKRQAMDITLPMYPAPEPTQTSTINYENIEQLCLIF